ncbi:putative membrane protein, partial [Yersinia pestis PY-66]
MSKCILLIRLITTYFT